MCVVWCGVCVWCGVVWCVCVMRVCVVWCGVVCVCVCVHMHLNVHIACVQDVTKQLEGLAKHLRASGKKPDSPHTQLALIGSSQAVLLVRKLSLGISVQGQW